MKLIYLLTPVSLAFSTGLAVPVIPTQGKNNIHSSSLALLTSDLNIVPRDSSAITAFRLILGNDLLDLRFCAFYIETNWGFSDDVTVDCAVTFNGVRISSPAAPQSTQYCLSYDTKRPTSSGATECASLRHVCMFVGIFHGYATVQFKEASAASCQKRKRELELLERQTNSSICMALASKNLPQVLK